MLTLILVAVVCLALGFAGAFVVVKYESKAAAKIQTTMNDVTAKVEEKVDAVTAKPAAKAAPEAEAKPAEDKAAK